jgi:hypothetical protein
MKRYFRWVWIGKLMLSEYIDMARGESFALSGGQQVGDALGHHLGLSGSRAGDELKIPPLVDDSLILVFGQIHADMLT